MRFLATAALCMIFAVSALAGDGSDTRYCESCLDIDDVLSPTPSYQLVSGSTVGEPNSEYAYSFCALAGGTYRFTFCEGGGTASFDTALSVQGPNVCGSYLVCNDDFCSLQSQVDFTAPADGVYIIVVDGYSSGTGAYTLAYRGPECQPPNPTHSASWGTIKSLYR